MPRDDVPLPFWPHVLPHALALVAAAADDDGCAESKVHVQSFGHLWRDKQH